jgi:hypothetical protein
MSIQFHLQAPSGDPQFGPGSLLMASNQLKLVQILDSVNKCPEMDRDLCWWLLHDPGFTLHSPELFRTYGYPWGQMLTSPWALKWECEWRQFPTEKQLVGKSRDGCIEPIKQVKETVINLTWSIWSCICFFVSKTLVLENFIKLRKWKYNFVTNLQYQNLYSLIST